MKRLVTLLATLATMLVAPVALTTAAPPADLSQPVILVASASLEGSPFEETVVVATPWRDGAHIGFILNKPTGVRLETLFPEDDAVHAVQESAYLGGPALPAVMFAVTRRPPANPHAAIPLMPGLYAVVDKDAIDHIIRTTPNEARYFVGAMVWTSGALEEQIDGRLWDVRAADADTVLRPKTSGLWQALRSRWGGQQA